jgi:cell division protein FtsI/penicillin-binding protein 2
MYYAEVEVAQLNPTSQREIAATISKLLDLPIEGLYAQLTKDWAAQGLYRFRLVRPLDDLRTIPITLDSTVAQVLEGFMADPLGPDLSGLDLVPAAKRTYPAGSVAGHALGFVNQEGEGYFGVEGYYDEWLSGKPITVERALIPPEARLQPDPPAGVNLVLTIDMSIQQAAEIALREAVDDSEAEAGQVIVMDPRSGEILAMAAYPLLDPNHYDSWMQGRKADEPAADDPEEDNGQASEEDEPAQPVISPAVAGVYEPGSTFKILTMAGALDAGVVTPDSIFIDTGQIEVGGNLIRNWDYAAYGQQNMVGCLQHSLNVCLAFVAYNQLGAARFYDYINAFGVGQITGVDMAGEVPGVVRTPRDPAWTESDVGTNSFGQGVAVTPIGLLAAASAIANNGNMVQPHIVREIVSPQGVFWPKTTILGTPITAQTAQTLTTMLADSLAGETYRAGVLGYRLAGKTGTAQIATRLGYDPSKTIASFIGWGPVDDPRFMILVRLDKPRSSPWGSVVAAPVFQEVAERLVVLLQIPPDALRIPVAALAPEGG